MSLISIFRNNLFSIRTTTFVLFVIVCLLVWRKISRSAHDAWSFATRQPCEELTTVFPYYFVVQVSRLQCIAVFKKKFFF